MKQNLDNYVWSHFKDVDDLVNARMTAMRKFLEDYDKGRREKRYVYHELPKPLSYPDNYFDLGLSSHFLLMYTAPGYDFHIAAISEMLRVCREVRIFPVVDLDAEKTELIDKVIAYFDKKFLTEIVKTDYEFQKGDNKMLIIRKE